MSDRPSKAYASIGGMVVGLISVIGSIVLFTSNIGSYIYRNTYGGDAYTGIQNAAADTGNNLLNLASICTKGFGFILLVLGLALICYFLHEFLADRECVNSVGNMKADNAKAATDALQETHEEAPEEIKEKTESLENDLDVEDLVQVGEENADSEGIPSEIAEEENL